MPNSHPIAVPADEAAEAPAAPVWRDNPLFADGTPFGPAAYAAFLRERLAALKATEPRLPRRERVRLAAAEWQARKRAARAGGVAA